MLIIESEKRERQDCKNLLLHLNVNNAGEVSAGTRAGLARDYWKI